MVRCGPAQALAVAARAPRGIEKFLGDDIIRGAQVAVDLWIEDFGGIEGHSISVLPWRDSCNGPGEAAQEVLAQAIAATSTVGVVGTACSGTAARVESILGDAGLSMVSPSNTSPSLTDGEPAFPGAPTREPGYFRVAHDDRWQGLVAADYAATRLGAPKAAIFYLDGDSYSTAIAQAFADAYPGAARLYGLTSPDDIAPALQEAASEGVGLVYLPIWDFAAIPLVEAARDLFEPDPIFLGSDSIAYDDSILAALGPGVIFTDLDMSLSGPLYDRFSERYRDRYGSGWSSPWAVYAFDAMWLLLHGLDEVATHDGGEVQVDLNALRGALEASRGTTGLLGAMDCREFLDPLGHDKAGQCGRRLPGVWRWDGAARHLVEAAGRVD